MAAKECQRGSCLRCMVQEITLSLSCICNSPGPRKLTSSNFSGSFLPPLAASSARSTRYPPSRAGRGSTFTTARLMLTITQNCRKASRHQASHTQQTQEFESLARSKSMMVQRSSCIINSWLETESIPRTPSLPQIKAYQQLSAAQVVVSWLHTVG